MQLVVELKLIGKCNNGLTGWTFVACNHLLLNQPHTPVIGFMVRVCSYLEEFVVCPPFGRGGGRRREELVRR